MRLHSKSSCRSCDVRCINDRIISRVASCLLATATISIALTTPFVNKRHACRHRGISFTHGSLFAHQPSRKGFGHRKRRPYSSIILSCAEAPARSSKQPSVQDKSHPPDMTTSASTKQTTKKRDIRFVSWAGKGGMLPLQTYSGVLNYEEYHHWLQIPLNVNASIPSAKVPNYFSTIPPSSSSSSSLLDNQTSTTTLHTNQNIDPPQVKPKHLKPIYIDDHITVVNKPSGVLSVPGPRRHECVASLAYRYFGKSTLDIDLDVARSHDICSQDAEHLMSNGTQTDSWNPLTAADNKKIDTMIVHRLDRDTSGVLMFARNDNALKQLHSDFKDKTRKNVNKRYVALVCGHWNCQRLKFDGITINEGEIDLPLVRDMDRPPFMRVATSDTILQQQQLKQQSQNEQTNLQEQKESQSNKQQRHQHSGYLRMVGKGAKASLTTYRILSYEYLIDSSCDWKDSNDLNGTEASPKRLPVTRVELQPITGRTHQLRVHCAAVGHPIVGDSIYGYQGEGSPNGGLNLDEAIDGASDLEEQKNIHNYWKSAKYNIDAEDDECMLCLHAYQLSVFHPLTESPMTFECPPPF